MSELIGREELVAITKQLATPIDFVELERQGLIEKKGAWYKIKDVHALPESAKRQVQAIKTGRDGSNYFKFVKSHAKAQKLYRKLTGREYNE